MKTLFELALLSLAVFIVLFSSATVFYGVKYLVITNFKRSFDWLVSMQVFIALAWVLIFGYIVEETIRVVPPTEVGSFGSLFIRPVILLSSVSISIWMYIRYKYEKSGRDNLWNLQKN